MIAGFWTFSLKPGAYANFRAYFNENVPNTVTTAPGFKRLGFYYDANANQVITVFEWESEEAAANVRAQPGFQPLMEGLGSFLTGAPTRQIYEMPQEALAPAGVGSR